jgi:hypothetical protein
MIYPDVNLETWLKKYPVLEVQKKRCHHCKSLRIANIPFIEKDWVGLQSKDCACGKGKAISVCTIRSTSEAFPLLENWIKHF